MEGKGASKKSSERTTALLTNREMFAAAIRGARAAINLAEKLLQDSIDRYSPDKTIEYPETAYELPSIYALDGRPSEKLGDLLPILKDAKKSFTDEPSLDQALAAGVATVLAAEIIEALKYIPSSRPYEGTPYCGFIPDRVLRELGVAVVDDTIPGVAVLVGHSKDRKALVKIVRDLQSKGMLIFASYDVIDQLREEGIKMGLDLMLYPVGSSTQLVHALNFAIRAALSFGGVQRGDRKALITYLAKRPKVFILHFGPIDDIQAAAEFAALAVGAPMVTDQSVEQLQGKMLYEPRYDKMVQTAIEARDIRVKLTPVHIPVAYGPAFEGETIRRPDTYLEAGGASKTLAFELLRLRREEEVEDGRVSVIGKDVDSIPEGGSTRLAIIVDVYGKKMQEDFEPVLERRIHQFINYAEGAWHTGQRNTLWVRLSKSSVHNGLMLKHFGEILITKLKEEFGNIVSRVQVTIITDESEMMELLPEALAAYKKRDERMAGLTDESVDRFFACSLCVPSSEDVLLADGSFLPMDGLVEQTADLGPQQMLTFSNNHMTARPTKELFINPAPSELVRITLRNGNSLKLTANHKVLVDSSEGLAWVAAGKLQIDDCLIDAMIGSRNGQSGSLFIIDYLPEDYRVSDDEFYDQLKTWILERDTIVSIAERTGIPYKRLYFSFCSNSITRRRLTLGEIKRIMMAIGKDWNSEKKRISRFQCNAVLKEKTLNSRIMYAAGLVASDGSVIWRGQNGSSGVYVKFTNSERALTTLFAEIIADFFGRPPSESKINPKTSFSDRLVIRGSRPIFVSWACDTLFGRLLNGLGIGPRDRGQKWNGYKISALPNELIAAFIRGLFDGDGHVSGNRIGITTRSQLEARHIHLLLKRLGVNSHISEIKRGFQVMTSSDGDTLLFRMRVGTCHPERKKKLEAVTWHQDRNHIVRCDSVSLSCGLHLATLIDRYSIQTNKLPVGFNSIKAWREGKVRASKSKLILLLDSIADKIPSNDPDFKALRAWSRSDVRFHKVRNVEHVKNHDTKVFNVSVEDTHNYVVNGIIVKNCQSFAADHICVITPERLGLCGALNWLDAKAGKEIAPTGPNQPINKGETIDEIKGQWKGVNEAVYELSHHKQERFNAYTMMEDPMTSCGCFEVIVAMTADAQAVIIVNREYPGMTPIGMKFSTLAGSVGGGKQTPGFIGVGRKYLTSKKFIAADGGFLRIAWMPKELKDAMRESLQKRAAELGVPDFVEKIADETITTTANGLSEWMIKVDHPALKMPPLLS